MTNAKKLPSGNWRIRICIGKDNNGKYTYKSFTAETKKEAEYLASNYLMNTKKKESKKTVFDAVDDYIKLKDNILSPSTVRGYIAIRRTALNGIGNKRICDLTDEDVQSWVNNNAQHYSSKSIKNQFGLLTAVIGNCNTKVDLKNIKLKPSKKSSYDVPTPEEMQQIIEVIKGTRVEVPVLLALMLGLRQSEIAYLKWHHYDGNKLNICGAKVLDKNHKYVEKDTNKSYAGTRTLDVPDYLKFVLDREKETSTSEYISPFRADSILQSFHLICKKNGLRKFKMHSLRHANASLMLLQGVSDKYAKERLGQSTQNMIKNVYQHTFKTEQDRISNIMNDVFNSLAKK